MVFLIVVTEFLIPIILSAVTNQTLSNAVIYSLIVMIVQIIHVAKIMKTYHVVKIFMEIYKVVVMKVEIKNAVIKLVQMTLF